MGEHLEHSWIQPTEHLHVQLYELGQQFANNMADLTIKNTPRDGRSITRKTIDKPGKPHKSQNAGCVSSGKTLVLSMNGGQLRLEHQDDNISNRNRSYQRSCFSTAT